MGQMLAAMNVGLLDADLDPAFHPRPHAVALAGLDDPGRAVDVQADPLAVKVQEDQADVGVLQDVAKRGHDPIAPVLGRAQVQTSSTWTKPGGPARNEQSHAPWPSAVAIQTIS
jgi:hypothetical protein